MDCPVDDAFRLFTKSFGEWWPLAAHSNSADAETCVLEPWPGGRIFERSRSGEEQDWGTVLECDPPGHLRFVWDPGGTGESSQTVEVEFSQEADDGTRINLTHAGWQSAGVAVCACQAFSAFAAEQMLVAY